MRLCSFASCLVVLAVLTACQAKVESIDIIPRKIEFTSDTQTRLLTATPIDKHGAVIEGDRAITWSSADPAVAAVEAGGKVKPTGSGSTTITATIDEKTATIPVTVAMLKRIQMQSLAMVVVAGVPSEPLPLNFINERGEAIPAEDRKVTWKTADAAVAQVSATGVVTGISAGSTLLSAEVGALKAEMTVTVNPAPELVPAVPGAPEPPAPAPK